MLRDEPLRFRLLKKPKAQGDSGCSSTISEAAVALKLDFGAYRVRRRHDWMPVQLEHRPESCVRSSDKLVRNNKELERRNDSNRTPRRSNEVSPAR